MRDLIELKKQVLEYCDRVKTNGGLVREYNCPDCGSVLMTTVPTDKNDVWDSLTKCYECGDMHFYVKKYNGVNAKSIKNVSKKG